MAATDNFAELIRQAHGGDTEALGRLLAQYRLELRASAERKLGGVRRRIDASDIIQQTMMEAHASFERFSGEERSELQAWLRSILHCNIANAIRDHLYAKKRSMNAERSLDSPNENTRNGTIPIPAREPSPSLQVSNVEQSLRLLDNLEMLSDEQRAAVQMRYLECRSVGEIATELGRSRAAAAGLVKRGLTKLRQLMNENE